MAIIVGIDEVGHGPRLGPLVVSAFGFRLADTAVDLWKERAPAVSSPGAWTKLPVLDSKDLYSTAVGIKALEPKEDGCKGRGQSPGDGSFSGFRGPSEGALEDPKTSNPLLSSLPGSPVRQAALRKPGE